MLGCCQVDSLFRVNHTDPWVKGDPYRTSRTISLQVAPPLTCASPLAAIKPLRSSPNKFHCEPPAWQPLRSHQQHVHAFVHPTLHPYQSMGLPLGG